MATGFGLLAGSWAAVGLLLDHGEPGTTSPVVGILAIAVGSAMLVPAATAWGSKPVATVLMSVAAARFAVTAVYELGGADPWKQVAGIIGIVLVATALYGSLALALEDAHHHAILPVSRRGTSRYAMSGDLGHQLDSLPTEVGVRQES
jgi:succinate-acetate transporter protein